VIGCGPAFDVMLSQATSGTMALFDLCRSSFFVHTMTLWRGRLSCPHIIVSWGQTIGTALAEGHVNVWFPALRGCEQL
jgi:hypothetical protein